MQRVTMEIASRFVIEALKPISPHLAGNTQASSQRLPGRARSTTRRFFSLPNRRNRKRVVAFLNTLNSEPFKFFTRPVSAGQIEAALQLLDQRLGEWDDNYSWTAWELVLPAIHELYPDRKCPGSAWPPACR